MKCDCDRCETMKVFDAEFQQMRDAIDIHDANEDSWNELFPQLEKMYFKLLKLHDLIEESGTCPEEKKNNLLNESIH